MPVRVIPGVTSALAVPALAGVAATYRGLPQGGVGQFRARPADTPEVTVADGSMPTRRILHGTAATIAPACTEAGIEPPAITVIGAVVALAEQLGMEV